MNNHDTKHEQILHKQIAVNCTVSIEKTIALACCVFFYLHINNTIEV